MALATGQVTTMDKVGSFRLPDESVPGWRTTRGPAAPAAMERPGDAAGVAPVRHQQAGAGVRGGAAPNARDRKQPGSDLVLRNLTTGEEVTIPEVTEYVWNKKGSLLAYAVSSNDATKDGAFVRRLPDGAVTTLHSGKGRYRSITFDDAGQQVAFLSDQAEFEKPVAPYRLYYWKSTEAKGSELVSASTPGMAKGMVVAENGAPRFSRDGARLFLGTSPPPAPAPDPNATTPEPIAVDLWSTKDPYIQPMQRVRADDERTRNYRAVVHLANRKFVQLATADLPDVNVGDDPESRRWHVRSRLPARGVLGQDLPRLLRDRFQDR